MASERYSGLFSSITFSCTDRLKKLRWLLVRRWLRTTKGITPVWIVSRHQSLTGRRRWVATPLLKARKSAEASFLNCQTPNDKSQDTIKLRHTSSTNENKGRSDNCTCLRSKTYSSMESRRGKVLGNTFPRLKTPGSEARNNTFIPRKRNPEAALSTHSRRWSNRLGTFHKPKH